MKANDRDLSSARHHLFENRRSITTDRNEAYMHQKFTKKLSRAYPYTSYIRVSFSAMKQPKPIFLVFRKVFGN